MGASIWAGGGVTPGPANIIEIREEIVATAGQTVFNLTLGTEYVPGTNNLEVYRNGQRLNSGDYTETDIDTITLASPGASVGDIMTFVILDNLGITAVVDQQLRTDLASITDAAKGAAMIGNIAAGNLAAANVQDAINELDTEKARLAGGNTFTGAQTIFGALGNLTLKYETSANIGAGSSFTITADDSPALKTWWVEDATGTRLYHWDSSVAVPNIPHTAIAPSFAVYGDVLLGDIVALESNPMTYFIRDKTGLAETAVTQLFSSRNGANDTDGGAGITYAPAKNGGGVVNDGYVDIIAYGLGSGAVANCVSFLTRESSGSALRRWQVNGQSTSKGDFLPVASNAYTIGATGLTVKEMYLAAGSGAGVGRPQRTLFVSAATGTGCAGDLVENDMKSVSIAANTLATNGDTIKFKAAFRCAANATTKRLRVKFGAMVLIDSTAIAHNNATIVIEGTIIRTGAATQVAYTTAIETADGPAWTTAVTGGADFSTGTETLSGAVTLKTTVLLGAGAALNDVIQDCFYVYYVPN